ncbi:hypothetical protein ACU8DI_14915 [Psychroserpens sp. BH13MA-6]
MNSNFEKIILDNQEIICPNSNQWEMIFDSEKIDGRKVPLIDLIKTKVIRNSKYSELKSCLTFTFNQIMFIELLEIDSELIRVFVERVICDNCGKRALLSATPGVSDLYIGLENKEKARERGYKHKNLNCKFCNSIYVRRYTIWQKYE